jgi:hypothetical protein
MLPCNARIACQRLAVASQLANPGGGAQPPHADGSVRCRPDQLIPPPPQGGSWYQRLLRWSMDQAPEVWRRERAPAPDLQQLTAGQQAHVQELAQLLLCKPGDVCRIVQRYPQLLEVEAAELVLRLLGLKQVLPGCDVARLVELQPRLVELQRLERRGRG